jgi:hypothetical protein
MPQVFEPKARFEGGPRGLKTLVLEAAFVETAPLRSCRPGDYLLVAAPLEVAMQHPSNLIGSCWRLPLSPVWIRGLPHLETLMQ